MDSAAAHRGGPPWVRIDGVTVSFGGLSAVSDVSLELPAGTITGLVGESGSGKSTLALALLGAVGQPGKITAGAVEIDGIGDVLRLDRRALRRVRGARIGYVFQAAQNSLNPLRTVGKQLLDLGNAHGVEDRRALVADATDLLGRMGLDADRVLRSYQHELSGGMRQRVGIMLALVLNAHVLVLDEPTTALDMITQANILRIVREIHAERGLTTLVVTHDVGVVAEVAQRLAVMYAGRIVEQGVTNEVLADPRHPYTRGLITAIPRLTGDIDAARPLPGRPPTLSTIPRQGCVFRHRCPLRVAICDEVMPAVLPAPAAPAGTSAGTSGGDRAGAVTAARSESERLVACHVVNEPAEGPGPGPGLPAQRPGPGPGLSDAAAGVPGEAVPGD